MADQTASLDIAPFLVYGPLLSAGAILLSALIAGIFAWSNIRQQREIARKRATLDLIASRRWDGDYLRNEREFIGLRDSSSGLMMWLADEHANSPQFSVIRNKLNDCELTATGILHGILDEQFYADWFRASYVLNWKKSREFVFSLRTKLNRDDIFDNYEKVAEKWAMGCSVLTGEKLNGCN